MQTDNHEEFEKHLWRIQEEDMSVDKDEVCAKARRRETLEISAYWTVLGCTVFFGAAFLRNLIYFRDSWLIAGTGWAMLALVFMAWRLLRNGPNIRHKVEPCAHFLYRALETKRSGLLCIRWLALLLIPAVVASWLGDGPVLRAKALGFSSPTVLHFLGGPVPLIVIAFTLGFIWFAFTRQSQKVGLEIEQLRALGIPSKPRL